MSDAVLQQLLISSTAACLYADSVLGPIAYTNGKYHLAV